jgi:hypothetical protein
VLAAELPWGNPKPRKKYDKKAVRINTLITFLQHPDNFVCFLQNRRCPAAAFMLAMHQNHARNAPKTGNPQRFAQVPSPAGGRPSGII